MLTFGTVVLTAAYVRAGMIVFDVHPPRRQLARAFAAGAVAFLPFPFLMLAFVFPGVAWLALVGLCVPVVARRGRLGTARASGARSRSRRRTTSTRSARWRRS